MTYGDDANKVSYSYDNLGRTAAKTLTVGGRAYETGYAYLPGSNGSGNTTALISAISQPGEAFSYTYDDVGNISSVTRNGMTTTYVYDRLGQLIRVNDPEDTAAGATWVYEYDLGGNILCKKRYAYTTGDLGSVLETIAYEYDTVWKDKLVKYDGNAITYDAIGNPLTDGTWTYTWEKGRQLKQMTKPGTTATFAYNADGLRIRKTVNGVDTNYTLHGKNIVHMTQGSNTLHFWYDAQNRPAIVQFNGEKYGYVVNLQGDIVSLIDNTGTEVVKYVYDAWGQILSTAGSLASTLGTIQPFRYRSYAYDPETGLYYLRSRYYNPVYSRFVCADYILENNVYAYCNNKPIFNIDSSGASFVCIAHFLLFDSSVEFVADGFELYSDPELSHFSQPNDMFEIGNVVYVQKTNRVGINRVKVQGKLPENGQREWYYGYARSDHSDKLLVDAYFPYGHVNQGNSDAIFTLQMLLLNLYNVSHNELLCCSFNGKYDDSTKEAVTEFQRIAGIAQDGIAGIDTCSHLAYWILQTDSRYKYLEFQLIDKRNYIIN